MAQIANTYDAYAAKGQREDLENSIYNITPWETPGMSSIGRSDAKAVKHEWQTDALASADASNAQLEGDDYTFSASSPTKRVGNFCQISRKEAIVSGTLDVVDKAGRKSEIGYQMEKRAKELKRDMEKIIFGSNQASSAGTTNSTPRKLGSFLSWVETNASRGSGGANGGYNTGTGLTVAATDGTTRAFAETQVKAVMQSAYSNGGKPTMLMLPPAQKVNFSAFAGIAINRVNIAPNPKEQATIVGAADFYVSDFGNLAIVPNIFMRSRDAILLDPEMAAVGYLRSFRRDRPAKTGDAEKRVVLAEYTLVVRNEAAHGVIADLT